MPRYVVVRFPAGRSNYYYQRVFFCAEYLWPFIVDAGLGKLHDIEHVRETIRIEVAATRHLGSVKLAVRKALKHHNLLDDATITTE